MKLDPLAFIGFFAAVAAGCGSSDALSSTTNGKGGADGGPGGASGSSGSAGAATAGAGGAGTAGSGGSAASPDGAAPKTGSGTVTGTVNGVAFTMIASAWWIGKPGAGSAPTQIYLSNATLACSDITAPGWDHLLGNDQLMELDLADSAPKKYSVGTDMDASYVKEPYNPSAQAGSVTITTTNTGKNIVGTYDLTFATGSGDGSVAAGDNVKGTFDAAYCADGVEP